MWLAIFFIVCLIYLLAKNARSNSTQQSAKPTNSMPAMMRSSPNGSGKTRPSTSGFGQKALV